VKLGQRIPVKIIDVPFFERSPKPDRLRERTAFFRDPARARFLDREEGTDLILELRIQPALLISAPIFFREENGRSRDCEDDEHHRQ
jgi:hypothetical protein